MEKEQTNKTFQSISPKEIDENTIRLIGEKWMLITAGDSSSFNTMTASWGTIGFLWGKPVVYVFIRPQRYTFEFVENRNEFTLSFFGEEYRNALKICGSLSGRNTNKVEKAGLTPKYTEMGNVTFEEANLILECKKLYSDFLNPDAFIDTTIIPTWYKEKDFHKIYVAEITNVWIKK